MFLESALGVANSWTPFYYLREFEFLFYLRSDYKNRFKNFQSQDFKLNPCVNTVLLLTSSLSRNRNIQIYASSFRISLFLPLTTRDFYDGSQTLSEWYYLNLLLRASILIWSLVSYSQIFAIKVAFMQNLRPFGFHV